MLHLFSSASEMKSGGCGGPNGTGFLPGLAFVLLGQRNTNESDRAWWQWLRRLCCTRSHSLKRRGGDSWLRVTYRFCKIRGNFAQRFTGSTFFIPQLNAKPFELVKAVCPYIVPVAALSDPDNPVSKPIIPAMRAAPRPLKLEFVVPKAQSPTQFEKAFASMAEKAGRNHGGWGIRPKLCSDCKSGSRKKVGVDWSTGICAGLGV
jgi:hypothetical protein